VRNLIIIGAGGFGRELAWLVERINTLSPTWNILGFLDDTYAKQGTEVGGYPVLGRCQGYVYNKDSWFVCAIGTANRRREVVERVSASHGVQFATLVDQSVMRSDRIAIGEGTIICAGAILTVDITIGKHVIINLDCTVGHDALIGDFVTLYPSVNISGNTVINDEVEFGTGSQIIQGKEVGSGSIIGAGAVVVRDIPQGCTAVGLPARPIKFHHVD